MTRYCDQSNLQKEGLICACGSREIGILHSGEAWLHTEGTVARAGSWVLTPSNISKRERERFGSGAKHMAIAGQPSPHPISQSNKSLFISTPLFLFFSWLMWTYHLPSCAYRLAQLDAALLTFFIIALLAHFPLTLFVPPCLLGYSQQDFQTRAGTRSEGLTNLAPISEPVSSRWPPPPNAFWKRKNLLGTMQTIWAVSSTKQWDDCTPTLWGLVFLKYLFHFNYMYMWMSVCGCVHTSVDAHRGWKKESGVLELQVVVNLPMWFLKIKPRSSKRAAHIHPLNLLSCPLRF